MAVRFQNFDYSFSRNGKSFFKPSKLGRKIGEDIKTQIEERYEFDPFVFHMRGGGHVAALHSHRPNNIFCRLDLERFFYGIGRNRVQRALRFIGLDRAEHYAKWSTVKNPYDRPSYALPYGFVQSPILATLVLMTSQVGDFLRNLPAGVNASVYMDDLIFSGTDNAAVTGAFDGLIQILATAGFAVNEEKTRPPSHTIDVFNCDLSFSTTTVRPERIAEFYEAPRDEGSQLAFGRYCASVQQGNTPNLDA